MTEKTLRNQVIDETMNDETTVRFSRVLTAYNEDDWLVLVCFGLLIHSSKPILIYVVFAVLSNLF